VHFAWNLEKAAANLIKHGVAFEAVFNMDFDTGLVRADVRLAYPEPRLVALAPINGRLFMLVYSIEPRRVRVISLRRANNREKSRYAES